MSDITYARKADVLMDVDTESVPERLALAQVAATQAVARAAREVDNKLKYVADQIVAAMPQPVERWVTWTDSEETRHAVNVQHIQGFKSTGSTTSLLMNDQTVVVVPVSFGTVAMMVGA